MALLFAKCLHVGEDGPGWGHLCHTGTFLVFSDRIPKNYIQSVLNKVIIFPFKPFGKNSH